MKYTKEKGKLINHLPTLVYLNFEYFFLRFSQKELRDISIKTCIEKNMQNTFFYYFQFLFVVYSIKYTEVTVPLAT